MKKLLLTLIFLSFALASCASPGQEKVTEDYESAYPISSTENQSDASSSYPISDDTQKVNQGPYFTIYEPVVNNSTIVEGEGPAELPIILVDVSEVGEVLATTTIDANGYFSFSLDTPLIQNHIIGLQLGDLSGTDFVEQDYQYSDSYFERPLVGILFDMVIVQ